VTDLKYTRKLSLARIGDLDLRGEGIRESDEILLTISLTEPFQDRCYKLVAAVTVIRRSSGRVDTLWSGLSKWLNR
jgi:hypothetical protein